MKQFAVIGADTFGKHILEELILLDCEVILLDKDPDVVEYYKNDVAAAYIANVINVETVNKLIPADVDAVVVDLGDKIETSILVTQHLCKIGVASIIVKAETDQHGEILSIVGAHHVVFPNIEAAKRLIPLLASDLLFHYLPISGDLIMAETGVPSDLVDRRLEDVKKIQGINVTAVRQGGKGEYRLPESEYKFQQDDTLLVVGHQGDIAAFTGKALALNRPGVSGIFRRLFGGSE